jgi:DNA-binding transcriptional ArsR family regulator
VTPKPRNDADPADLSDFPRLLMANAPAVESLLKALASHHRLMILCILQREELTAGDLSTRLNLTMSNTSRHLAEWRAERVVATRRDGTFVYYRFASARAAAIMEVLKRLLSSTGQNFS